MHKLDFITKQLTQAKAKKKVILKFLSDDHINLFFLLKSVISFVWFFGFIVRFIWLWDYQMLGFMTLEDCELTEL